MSKVKDFLTVENQRNKDHAQLYVDLVQRAYGCNNAVLIGHHIVFEADGDITTENEIPAADTLLFDHEIMTAVFGEDKAMRLMSNMAVTPVEHRDALLQQAWDKLVSDNGWAAIDDQYAQVQPNEPKTFDKLYGLDGESDLVYLSDNY